MELEVTAKAQDGRTVRMTASQAQAIEALNNTRKGGCSSVTGYRPTTGWVTSPVQNIQMITHISIHNLYERRLKALEAIEYGDISRAAAKDEVLKDMKVSELLEHFDARKATLMKSVSNSLENAPKNNHQKAHDVCYARIGDVKVHLDTVMVGKGKDKHKEPVVNDDGHVTLKSIMIPYLELNKTTVKEGVRKPAPNSGAPVRVGNLIEQCLNKRSVVLKTLSLKEDNFESIQASGQQIMAEDVARLGDLIDES